MVGTPYIPILGLTPGNHIDYQGYELRRGVLWNVTAGALPAKLGALGFRIDPGDTGIVFFDQNLNSGAGAEERILRGLYNETISGDWTFTGLLTAASLAATNVYTIVEANQAFVQNQSAITGLAGGAATDLDSLVTLGVAVGPLVAVTVGRFIDHYRLKSGTVAEDLPTIVRPDDYATTTNEKYWQLEQHGDGFTFTQVSPSTTWTITHNLLYRPVTIEIWVNDKISLAQVDHVSTSEFIVTMDTAQSGLVRYK